MSRPARYLMIGGFLGAGKSTAMGRLARHLSDRGQTVGLITNDQASGLVDTLNLRSQGFEVEEIAGGCFCCRFNSLLEAARRLDESTRPDVFLAEPVGSCTDLVATVSYPLRRIYGEDYQVAPFSVLVDPVRAQRVLGLTEGRNFSPRVTYVYRKQLEEADALLINKVDLLDETSLEQLRAALEKEFPGKEILEISARDGTGLEAWFEYLDATPQGRSLPLSIDYDTYAEGEALLGWLNATVEVEVSGSQAIDANVLIHELASDLGRRLEEASALVAHLKMTLSPDGALSDEIALVSLVREGFVPELAHELPGPIRSGQLIINLRAEADPDLLRSLVEETLEAARERQDLGRLELEHVENFRPGRPVPTHRDSAP